MVLVGLFKKPEERRQIRCYWKAIPREWHRGQNLESTLGIDGLCVTDRQGRLVWFQTAENIPTFGHLPSLTLEPLVLYLNQLLGFLQLIVQRLKRTENSARFTLKYLTEIISKVDSGSSPNKVCDRAKVFHLQ